MPVKKEKVKQDNKVKLEWKYVGLSVLAGLLYYLAYYLKFPNSYSAVVSLVLLFLLLKNFKSLNAVSIIIYSTIISAVILPMTVFLMPLSLTYQLIVLFVNLLLILVVSWGLYKTRRWAIILAIIVNLVSAYTLTYSAVLIFKQVAFNIYLALFLLRNALSLIVVLAVIVYLLSSWNKFK